MVKPTLAPGSKAMVGRNLRWVREIVSPSMSDCARMLGVEVGTWSLWELGKRYPDPAAMVRFCTSTGVTMDFLYRSDLRGVAEDAQIRLAAYHPELVPPMDKPHPGKRAGARSRIVVRTEMKAPES